MSQERRLKDTFVILLGLALIIGIGIWSFFRLKNNQQSDKSSLSDTTQREIATDFHTITLQKLQDIVLQKDPNDRTRIIDMRPASLWADEHIIGSESLIIEDAEQFFQPAATEKSQNWVIVAPSTSLAGQLVALMRTQGIPDEHISVFDGTYESWKEKTGLIIRRADPTSSLDVTKVILTSPEKAKEKIGSGGQWFILDIRSPNLFSQGHIAGATNIPLANVETNRGMIPSTANILIYGASDRESFAGGVLLFDLGFFNTITLSSGFNEWKAKNLPIEK